MFVGVSRFELRVPESGSLKAKRHIVKGIVGGLRSKFNVAVAEVDHQDTWQRCALGVTCVSERAFHVKKMLHEIERYVARDLRVQIISNETDVFSPTDE